MASNINPLDHLLHELLGNNDERAEQAALQLVQAGQQAETQLLALAGSPNENTQWWALRALAEFDTKPARTVIQSALFHPTLSIRQCAVMGLFQSPHISSISGLIEALSDSDSIVSRGAGNALIKIGKESTPKLLEVVAQPKHSGRLEATRALAMIGDKRSIRQLFKLIDNDSAMLEYWANEGLDKMGIGMAFFKPG